MSMDPTAFVETVEIAQQGDVVNVALTGAVAAAVVYGRQAAELLTKLIPDSAGGWLGTVRNVAAVISGYRKNNTD